MDAPLAKFAVIPVAYKGYIKGNVQWVHKKINQIKMDLKNDEFITLCNLIAQINPRSKTEIDEYTKHIDWSILRTIRK